MMNIFALAAGNDNLSTAIIVPVVGMAVIFVVLALLWGAIEIMHAIFGGKKEKKEAPQPQKAAASAPVVSVPMDDGAIAAAIAAAMAASDDGAVIAAITAAISAKRAEEGDSGSFRVVSFKRVGKRNARRGF